MTPAPCAMVAFRGTAVDPAVGELVADPRVAGVTLYRSLNVGSASETRELTADLVRAANRDLLIGIDQETGQLMGAGAETTHFAGNMALGATGDHDLAAEVGKAIGTELRALGINVNYAPVADIASRPGNPSLGTRAFGESPEAVARMTASMVTGLQSAGVAATLKHFPGKGEAAVDPHYELPVLDLDRERLEAVEFSPFRAGVAAGAHLLMVGHYGLPAITGDRTTPTSVAPAVLRDLIRDELGFSGLVITDALDMGGFRGYENDLPLEAGADLLLYGPAQAASLPNRVAPHPGRVDGLLRWLGSFAQPDLAVVGCTAHANLATELARRSITLVRDDGGLLPLRLDIEQRILAIMPQPVDLTPADTSSFVTPGLAAALRVHHPSTSEIVIDRTIGASDIPSIVVAAADHDVIVVGTIDATDDQARLVTALLATGKPVVTMALRTPYDLALYSAAPTFLCTYGVHRPSMDALAAALFGSAAIQGKLPVSIPGLYPMGHGLQREARR